MSYILEMHILTHTNSERREWHSDTWQTKCTWQKNGNHCAIEL